MSEEAIQRLLPGRRLRQAREQSGMTEEQVARRLHMSVTFVRAIEADDYERLPEAAFIKGYMRNYARLVDLPADEVANLFQQMIEEDEGRDADYDQPAEQGEPRSSRSPLIWIAPLVLLLLVLGWWLGTGQGNDAPPLPAGQPEQGVPPMTASEQSLALSEQAEASAEADSAADSDAVAANGPDQAADVVEAPGQAAVTPDRLTVSFNGPCWVQVLDASGETLFSGQRDDSNPLSVSGLGPFRLTFGNGAAVSSLAVNDEPVSVPPSAPGNVVRFTAP